MRVRWGRGFAPRRKTLFLPENGRGGKVFLWRAGMEKAKLCGGSVQSGRMGAEVRDEKMMNV